MPETIAGLDPIQWMIILGVGYVVYLVTGAIRKRRGGK